MSQCLSQQCSISLSEEPRKKPPRGFVDIPGYEGKYAISRDGEVYSYPKYRSHKGIIKKPKLLSGYMTIDLVFAPKKKRGKSIHRLLAETFLFNPDQRKYIEVNHIDGNKLNNVLENLEWCTSSENKKHAFATGLSYIPEHTRLRWRKSGFVNAMTMRKPVLQLSEKGSVINRFNGIRDASRALGLNHRRIVDVLKGKRGIYAGFKWRYEYQVH